MKRIVKETTKVIEEVTYEAYDGESFKDEQECIKYEETARAVIEKAFYALMVGGEPFDETRIWENFGYGSEEYDFAVIDIKDAHDLEIANRYYTFHKASEIIPDSFIGKKVLVQIGYCYDSIKETNPNPRTMEELIEQFTNDMDKFFNPKPKEEK